MKMHWKMKNISKSCYHFGSRVILITFGCSLFQFWFFFHHVSRHLTVYIVFSLFDQEDNYSVLLYISFYSLTDFSQYKHVIFSLVWKQGKKTKQMKLHKDSQFWLATECILKNSGENVVSVSSMIPLIHHYCLHLHSK